MIREIWSGVGGFGARAGVYLSAGYTQVLPYYTPVSKKQKYTLIWRNSYILNC